MRWWTDSGELRGQRTTEVGSIASLLRQEDDSVVLFLAPIVDTAAPVWVVATEWIDIQVGTENSSRWELTYSDDHMASVGDLVRGVIEGGATEFRAFGRSRSLRGRRSWDVAS